MKKKFKDGIYSSKQNTLMILMHLLYLGTIPYLVSAYFFKRNCLVYEAFGFVLLSFIIIIIVGVLSSPGYKAIRKYKKSGNCNDFIHDLDKLKAMSDRINDETINYIEMLRVNVYFLVDVEKAKELFIKLKVPTHKYYKGIYQRLEIDYLISINNLEEARKKVASYRLKNPIVERYIIVLEVNDISYYEENIERIIRTNLSKKIDLINNLSYLMTYFSLRNNEEKAKFYAEKILSLNTDCTAINLKAKKVLGIN